jgi:hypothetical protein
MSDAPYVLFTDERVEYRASALGGCDLALLAARLGYDVVPVKEGAKILEVFEAGKRIEDEVLDRIGLLSPITARQLEVVLPITKKIHVVGHIDGLDTSDGSLVEVKSQSQEEWDRFERDGWEGGFFPKYKWQVSAYMNAVKQPLTLLRALRDSDGNWTGRIEDDYIEEPFYSVAEIRERVLKVEAAAATGVLNAVCTPSYPCPYFYLHEEIDRELIGDEGVDALAREYADAQRDENIAKGRKAEARRALREAVSEDKYRTNSGVKVTFYTALNPPKLDRELLTSVLQPIGRDLDEFFTQSKGQRVKVSLPKEDDESASAI